MDYYRWKGFLMGAVEIKPSLRQIHLWTPMNNDALCGSFRWSRDAVDKDAATGWPDCNECIQEAFKRLEKAA